MNFDLLNVIETEMAKTIGTWVDVALIAIVVIIALVGFSKGFVQYFLKFVGSVGAIVLAIFTAKPVLAFVNSIFNISSGLGDLVVNNLGISTILTSTLETAGDKTAVIDAINNSGLLDFLKSFFVSLIEGATPATDLTVGSVVTPAIGTIVATVLVAVVLFFVIKIIIKLLAKLFEEKEAQRGYKSGMDRLLGFILGLAKGALFVAVIFTICYVLNLTAIGNDYINPILQETTVVKPIFEWFDTQVNSLIMSINWDELIAGIIGA